ncbi:MAG: hypothetical protein R3C10_19665 [Pirellulales bacterium]
MQTDRPVMEHLLYACLLEDAHHQAAEDALAAVTDAFFDWNEVRVTTIGELAEMMPMLPDPQSAARRLRETLQSVFESVYSFDLEPYRKLNLGHASKKLERLKGTTFFTVGYVVQMALGGHTIPLSRGTLAALKIAGVITDKEAERGVVPGLERAVPKSKGVEFATILHQLGADFFANPYDTSVHAVLMEISPDCKSDLPKKLTKRQKEAIERKRQKEEEAVAKAVADKKAAAEKAEAAKKAATKKAAAKKPVDEKKSSPKSADKKSATKKATKSAAKRSVAAKSSGTKKKTASKSSGKTTKKPATSKGKKATTKKSRRSVARGAPRKPR